jgi:hypothetical protein
MSGRKRPAVLPKPSGDSSWIRATGTRTVRPVGRRTEPGAGALWILVVIGLALGIGATGWIAAGARLPSTASAASPSPTATVTVEGPRLSPVRAEIPAGASPGADVTTRRTPAAAAIPAAPVASTSRTGTDVAPSLPASHGRTGFPPAPVDGGPTQAGDAVTGTGEHPAAGVSPIGFDYPRDGETAPSRIINVVGHAPPGATVVRILPTGPDGSMVARPDGLWLLRVELVAGANRLTFRLGDDDSTAATLTVVWQPH